MIGERIQQVAHRFPDMICFYNSHGKKSITSDELINFQIQTQIQTHNSGASFETRATTWFISRKQEEIFEIQNTVSYLIWKNQRYTKTDCSKTEQGYVWQAHAQSIRINHSTSVSSVPHSSMVLGTFPTPTTCSLLSHRMPHHHLHVGNVKLFLSFDHSTSNLVALPATS